MRMVNGSMTTAVAIKTDGEQTIDPACVPPTVTDKPSLMAAVQNCGLVGVAAPVSRPMSSWLPTPSIRCSSTQPSVSLT